MSKKYKVLIIESERGWGQRVDEELSFNSIEERDKFIKEYNSKNNLPYIPDWYMYATPAD